jgi:FtsZ-interacting cell division protein ZipA
MISDFQLVLIGIIAVIIVGVIVYNRWQESRYKKRAEQMFAPERSDALFDEPAASAASAASGASGTFERREPSFGKLDVAEQVALDDLTAPVAAPVGRLPAEEMVEPRNLVRGAASELVPAINAEVDTIAMMLADTPVHADVYAPMIEQSHSLGGNILWEGLVGGLWQPIDPTLDAEYREIRAALQLANRAGAVEASVLAQFDDAMASFAASIGAVSQREDVNQAQRRAQMVDQFCAETDIEIAVNIAGKNGVTFAATKVRGVAEAQGLVALASGEYVLKDDYGRTLFSLRNGNTHEAPTLRGELPYFTQITFALDVPRTPQPGQIFERMFTLALQFADVLHGEVVDDNKKLLTASGRKVIAETIHGITGEMQQRGVTPGSSVALRLYA